MKRTKAWAQRVHAKRRMFERYSVVLTRAVEDDILRQIHSGSATFVERQSCRLTIWDVTVHTSDGVEEVAERRARVVYDKNRGQLVTALPPDGTVLDAELEGADDGGEVG